MTTRTEETAAKNAARVRSVELLISNLLRIGVTTSLVLVVIGTVLTFARHPSYTSTPADLQRLTQPGAAFPHTLKDVFDGALHLRGQGVVAIGLLVLLITPVLRVAVAVVAFEYQGDRVYVVLTTTVLLLLLLSFVLGLAGG